MVPHPTHVHSHSVILRVTRMKIKIWIKSFLYLCFEKNEAGFHFMAKEQFTPHLCFLNDCFAPQSPECRCFMCGGGSLHQFSGKQLPSTQSGPFTASICRAVNHTCQWICALLSQCSSCAFAYDLQEYGKSF